MLQHLADTLLEHPFLAVRTASVGRRVEDDAGIAVAAAHLALHEFQRILHDPAHPVQPAPLHVLARPGHHLPHRIHVRHLGPGRPGRERRAARIGEQVQHLRHAFRPLAAPRGRTAAGQLPAAVVDEIPVGGLLGKNPDVLERRQRQPHPEAHPPAGILHCPAVGHTGRKAPLAALLAASVASERSVGPPPLRLRQRPPPDGLRLRTARDEAAETLQFLEIARIEQFVIPECGGQLHLHSFRKSKNTLRPARRKHPPALRPGGRRRQTEEERAVPRHGGRTRKTPGRTAPAYFTTGFSRNRNV